MKFRGKVERRMVSGQQGHHWCQENYRWAVESWKGEEKNQQGIKRLHGSNGWRVAKKGQEKELPGCLEKKWNENVKERQKSTIRQIFTRIDKDLATIRARVLPVEKYQTTRKELVRESVESILTSKLDHESVEGNALKKVVEHDELKQMSQPEIHENIKKPNSFEPAFGRLQHRAS